MTRRTVRKVRAQKGFSLQEEAPPEEPMAYDEEDDLSDLLGEDEEEEPPMPMPEEEEEEGGFALAREIDGLYKLQDDSDSNTIALAKALRFIAKRVIALEGKSDDESEEDKEDKGGRKVDMEAAEADMPVGGTQDMGEDIQQGGEAQEPGLTAGQPQGIAQKALIATELEKAKVHPDIIAKATGLIRKDDKWSNFGDKDSDVPANAPVTPDTKDWDEDFEIVPGSGNAPSSVKGIGSVHKALVKLGIDADKVFEGAGIIRKAQAVTVGAGATGDALTVDEIEKQARSLSFRDIARMADEHGVQYWQ